MERKRTKKIGITLCLVGIILTLVLGGFFYLSLKERFLTHRIQNSVEVMDREMRFLIDQGLNHDAMEKSQTGLTIFMNDTLVYWNRNDVNPKLMKRKVVVGHDTICPLLSGNYFVKSYDAGNMTYYVYKLINTTYQIDNPYFANVNKTVPEFIDADIRLLDNGGGVPLMNADGKVLANYQIADKPRLKELFRYLWPLPFLVLVVVGLVLAFRKHKEPQEKVSKKSYVIEIGMVVILLVSLIGTYVFYKISVKNENEQMRQQAQHLMEKRDIDFESSYARFAQQMKTDTTMRDMLFAESNVLADVILGYSKDLLFDETMKAYSTTLTLCAPGDEITIQPEGFVTQCDSYFREKLDNNKNERVGDNLYFMDYYTLDPNYLARIDIAKDSLKKALYFEFYKPIAPEGFGFPQLLKESNSLMPYDYSVASFKGNLLVYKYGRYVYPNFLNSLKVKDHDFTYTSTYKHYAIIDGENNAVVISV